jgi:hypothetical protein
MITVEEKCQGMLSSSLHDDFLELQYKLLHVSISCVATRQHSTICAKQPKALYSEEFALLPEHSHHPVTVQIIQQAQHTDRSRTIDKTRNRESLRASFGFFFFNFDTHAHHHHDCRF